MSDKKLPAELRRLGGDLFIVKLEGEWPLEICVGEDHARTQARRISTGRGGRVLILRIDSLEITELEIQREIIRESLVPRGTAVQS